MKTTECTRCGKQAQIVKRIRDTVPLLDQKFSCHWIQCRHCCTSYWKWIPPTVEPVYCGTGAIYDA